MKATFKSLLALAVLLTGLGHIKAQSAASSSKKVVEESNAEVPVVPMAVDDTSMYSYRRGIPLPDNIQGLIDKGDITGAIKEFDKFSTTMKKAKADPYQLKHCEMVLYIMAQSHDPANGKQYFQKAESIRQELITKYPNVSDAYLLQIDFDTPDDKIVELATKAIELDSENLHAYEQRGRALFHLEKIKEACQDLEKLPWKASLPEYWPCLETVKH